MTIHHMPARGPDHLPPDEYVHLPLVVHIDGMCYEIGEATIQGSHVSFVTENSAISKQIMDHLSRTGELSIYMSVIPRPRLRKKPVGNPRRRFDETDHTNVSRMIVEK